MICTGSDNCIFSSKLVLVERMMPRSRLLGSQNFRVQTRKQVTWTRKLPVRTRESGLIAAARLGSRDVDNLPHASFAVRNFIVIQHNVSLCILRCWWAWMRTLNFSILFVYLNFHKFPSSDFRVHRNVLNSELEKTNSEIPTSEQSETWHEMQKWFSQWCQEGHMHQSTE